MAQAQSLQKVVRDIYNTIGVYTHTQTHTHTKQTKLKKLNYINPLNASTAFILKPVNWFAVQINWLVSTWGQHWHLLG